jgi:hypothetical protein
MDMTTALKTNLGQPEQMLRRMAGNLGWFKPTVNS